MKLIIGFCLLFLFLPIVSAQSNQNELNQILFGEQLGTTIIYPIKNFNSNLVGTISTTYDSIRLDNRPVSQITHIFLFSISHVIDLDSNGIWRFQVSVDSVNIENCYWDIQTWNTLSVGEDAKENINILISCKLSPSPVFGNHFVNITRTIQSGTPDTIESKNFNMVVFSVDTILLTADSQIAEILRMGFWFLPALIAIILIHPSSKFQSPMIGAFFGLFSIFWALNEFTGIFQTILIGLSFVFLVSAMATRSKNKKKAIIA